MTKGEPLVFFQKYNIIGVIAKNKIGVDMETKSVVLAELDNHLRHLFEYKFFNKFYNAVEIICRYTLVGTSLAVIIGCFFLSSNENASEIGVMDFLTIVCGVSFFIISVTIIIREITILCYGKIYGESFKQYVAVKEEDIENIIQKMKKETTDEKFLADIEKVVKKYKYKENGLYVIFTDGINKKVIKELMKVELNYKLSKRSAKLNKKDL